MEEPFFVRWCGLLAGEHPGEEGLIYVDKVCNVIDEEIVKSAYYHTC